MQSLLIICGACLGLYGVFLLFSTWFFAKEKSPAPHTDQVFPSISVVIPARNEAKDIEACLSGVLGQTYPGEFEVILVDDQSTDNTRELASTSFGHDKRLQILQTTKPGKKAAISTAIAVAQGEWIVQTDADCHMDKEWLLALSQTFTDQMDFVSGPVALTYKSHFEAFQALESMGLVVFGAGFLLAGIPNMANGANMAFRKKVFLELEGYKGVDHVASGDDELFLQKITLSGKYGMSFCKDKQAIVRTGALSRWKDFREQRIRWVSKSKAYINKTPNVIQAISYLGFLFFPLILLASLNNPVYLCWGLLAFMGKLLIDMIIMYQAARFFHNLRLLRWFLPLQILYIPYVIWIGMASLFVKRYSWKGRKVS